MWRQALRGGMATGPGCHPLRRRLPVSAASGQLCLPGAVYTSGAVTASSPTYGVASYHEARACTRGDACAYSRPGAVSYTLPRGDWFDLIPCAHYLAEIVIYAGLVIAGGCRPAPVRRVTVDFSCTDFTQALLLLAVMANLAIAARSTLDYYAVSCPVRASKPA